MHVTDTIANGSKKSLTDQTDLCLEDPVAGVALEVVGGLVEVAHPRDVVLPRLAHVRAALRYHHRRVPQHVAVLLVALLHLQEIEESA